MLPEIVGMDIFVVFIVILAFTYYVLFLSRKAKNGVPPEWPFVGMLPSLFIHFNDLYDTISRILIECGGTFIVKGLPQPTVLTSDPTNVEYILTTKFSSFPKGPGFRSAFTDLFGDGLFNVDGEPWIQQRKASVVQLNSVSSLTYVLKSVQESLLQNLIPILDNTVSTGSAMDLQDIFFRFTFDNICKFAFGVEMGCLSPSLPAIPFVKAFDDAVEASCSRFTTPISFRKIMRCLGLGIDAKLQSALKTIDQFVMEIVSSRREELGIAKNRMSDSRADLLSIFMKSPDKNGVPYSDTFLRGICLSFILAGSDTTSVALSWFFWLLLQHSHVEENILKEIHRILKDRPAHVKPGDPVCFSREELKEMHYLHACLSETMRLYPPVPLGRKEAIEDEVLPDGTPMKKGTAIMYVTYAMGRMESIWGSDCMEFKPKRWLNDEGAFVNQSVYRYPVFHGGPRMCLGRDFAYLQMKHIAASILYRYKLRLVNEGEEVKYKVGGLTLFMKNGLPVTVQSRVTEQSRYYSV
uniref:Cytochrome P450 CYP86N2v2 n=1 Tax=Picea glauca TaxID=3330 RepID=A0A0G7ZNY5_PICGL